MNSIDDPDVAAVFGSCPDKLLPQVMNLRRLILDTAKETDGVGKLQETLKWGQPSYVTSASKSGSTIRIGWKASRAHQYGLYFHCGTRLVETFKEIFADKFRYDNNRAILFLLTDEIPEQELKYCIALGLTYHRVNHMPLLGA